MITRRKCSLAAACRGIVVTGALVAALALQAQESTSSKSSEHTSSIRGGDAASCLKEAAQMNNSVIKFAELASEKAQNSKLKEFSETLEKDHKQAQQKLERIAEKHAVTLPTGLTDECKKELSKLQGLSGAEFDKEFASGAVKGHAMALAHLREAASQAKDDDVRQYVNDMLDKVKRHQEKGREVAQAVGLDQATIASLEKLPPEGVGTSGSGTESSRGSSGQKDDETQEHRDTPREP